MKIALVTDAWLPQVNGVVTTLLELCKELTHMGHTALVIQPGRFRTRPCPGYPGIELAVRPKWGYALFRHFHKPSSGVMVPTRSVLDMLAQRGFQNLREWTHGVDTSLFEFQETARVYPPLGLLPRPMALFVGRVSYEKNISAFLDMDFPGSKVVCGVGPVEVQLKQKYPHVRWLGLLDRKELAQVYAAADLFVFPSYADTFGLVMVEAMATGTPVAAFPADGPLEVLGRMNAEGRSLGGAMNPDLQQAAYAALAVPRREARERAMDFSWSQASQMFAGHLVPARGGQPALAQLAKSSVTQPS